MTISKRNFILGAGGTLALVGAAGTWRVTRMPKTAIAPWTLDPRPPADVRLDAFRHAILAPNPHNRQPWLIKLDGIDSAVVSCDLDKRLPHTDPFDRQITIGFGTFIELARIAAAERGFQVVVTPFPDGEPRPRLDTRPVAHLRFIPDETVARDPLYAQITKRHTNKESFDLSRKLPDAVVLQIAGIGGAFTTRPAQISALREQILKAVGTEMNIPRTNMESVHLMRIGHQEIDANPDGIDLGGPFMETLKLFGQIDRDALGEIGSTVHQVGIDQLHETYGSIGGLVWITTPGNSRFDQIEAGRLYVRAHLRATELGISMHPMSQSLQEYAEVADPYAKVHHLLGASGDERVQMLARIGYGPKIGPAPRRPLETHLDPKPTTFAHRDGVDFGSLQGARSE